MSRAIITPTGRPLHGSPKLPGDKSISHRRALLSLYVDGDVVLENYSDGQDCQTTLSCLERLGKRVERTDNRVVLTGPAVSSNGELDCGNSGTTARLLMGILAGREGEWILRGDESLSRRPMERVADPLRRMGAQITTAGGRLPAWISGRKLHGIAYDSSLASAQVKSAVLLAALSAEGVTRYHEPFPSRDHTERILGISADGEGWITLDPARTRVETDRLSAVVPGDPSAAAFWVAAVVLVADSSLEMRGVLANPIRLSYLDALKSAGVRVLIRDEYASYGETVATIEAQYSPIGCFNLGRENVPGVIDELPVLAVMSACSDGISTFHGVSELRRKESNRLQLLAEGLTRMGALAEHDEDSLTIRGGALHGAEIETHGDHRIAMAFAVAALAAKGNSVIQDVECVAVSYPDFWEELDRMVPGSVKIEL
ncbi:3-phosphoshikimate 1-carboxyvinyltransferase [bacterium]|nr:3-phosphoshikimate 1-carboxyvinyltransferase [bacterium]